MSEISGMSEFSELSAIHPIHIEKLLNLMKCARLLVVTSMYVV